ncbi:hypothetical protein E4T56_gene12643 [Termitomyces sp. T112]|nr:hypothetical protein E4T56_gene12643 [Termitomyces sp. T112]
MRECDRCVGHHWQDRVYSIAFTPDARGLVSGSLNQTLEYWDIRGLPEVVPQCLLGFIGHKDHVFSVSVSHDGLWVVSSSKDNTVQF